MIDPEKMRLFMQALKPDLPRLARQVFIENPQTAMRELPGKLQASRDFLNQYEPGQGIDPRLMDQFMNLTGSFAPMGMTSAIGKKAVQESMSLPHGIEDVTTIPIPSKFGGVNTEEYLFHGGIKGKLDPMSKRRNLQGAEAIDGIVPTSFSKSPQEALEYTSISGGDIVAIPKSSVKIYEGGNKKLDEAFMSNNIKALKDAGYDGVDTRSIYPGSYREVVIWNLDKAAKNALYAPVKSSSTETYIREKLKSLLD